MKTFLQFVLAGVIGLSAATAQSAENRYSLILRGTCKSISPDGEIGRTPHSTRTIIADCAAAQEPPLDPRGLALVYDITQGVAYVVDKATGDDVCEAFSLQTRSALGNHAGTKWELLINIDDAAAAEEDGGALCTLGINIDGSGQVTRFRIRGRYHLVYGDNVTGQPIVCSGTIVTGSKFTPRPSRRR